MIQSHARIAPFFGIRNGFFIFPRNNIHVVAFVPFPLRGEDGSGCLPRCRYPLLLQQDNSPDYIFQRRYRSFVSRGRCIRLKERYKANSANKAGSEFGKGASVGSFLLSETALQRRSERGGSGASVVRQAVCRFDSQRPLGAGSHVSARRADSRFAESASVREERVRHGGSRQQMHAFHGIDLPRRGEHRFNHRDDGDGPRRSGASSASCTACTAFGRLEHLDEHEAVRARGARGEPPVLEVDQGRSAELPGAQAFDARRGGHESPGALHRIRGYSLLRVRTALRPQEIPQFPALHLHLRNDEGGNPA